MKNETQLTDETANNAKANVRRSYSWRATKMKFWFRLFAMFDVLFAEKFELTTWNKKGEQKAKTKFSKSEIDNAGRSGLL